MDAESFVACKGRGEAPRLLGHRLGDANVRILEPRPPEEPANRRGVDVAALDPCDEVWQYPTLYGWRDDRAPVSSCPHLRPSGWRRPPLRASSRLNRAHLAWPFPSDRTPGLSETHRAGDRAPWLTLQRTSSFLGGPGRSHFAGFQRVTYMSPTDLLCERFGDEASSNP